LIHGFRGYYSEIYGGDYIEGNPVFVNPSAYNFYLLSNSPAIDNGSPVNAPKEDYEGNLRPFGSGYDIGAYEYSGSKSIKK